MPRKSRTPNEPFTPEPLSGPVNVIEPIVDELSNAVIDVQAESAAPTPTPPRRLSEEEKRAQYEREHGGPQGLAKTNPPKPKGRAKNMPAKKSPPIITHDANGELALSLGRSVAIVPNGQHLLTDMPLKDGTVMQVLLPNKIVRRF